VDRGDKLLRALLVGDYQVSALVLDVAAARNGGPGRWLGVWPTLARQAQCERRRGNDQSAIQSFVLIVICVFSILILRGRTDICHSLFHLYVLAWILIPLNMPREPEHIGLLTPCVVLLNTLCNKTLILHITIYIPICTLTGGVFSLLYAELLALALHLLSMKPGSQLYIYHLKKL
jgi:hypothetical protein